MRFVNLENAQRIYDCSADYEIYWHKVSQIELFHLYEQITTFDRKVAISDSGDFFSPLLRLLKRVRFHLSTLPLPLNTPEIYPPGLWETFDLISGKTRYIYPEFDSVVKEVKKQLEIVHSINFNPFLNCIKSFVNQNEKIAVLIKEAHFISRVEAEIDPKLRGIKIVSQDYLRSSNNYSRVTVIGPSCLFPASIFNAPRARRFDVIHYNWIKDRFENSKYFLASNAFNTGIRISDNGKQVIRDNKAFEMGQDFFLEGEELLPTINWTKTKEVFPEEEMANSFEAAQAFALLLGSEKIVFLESSEEEKAWVINLDDESVSKIKKIPALEIRSGMFLLLRTSGGGDYMIALADQILGDKASIVRETQERWKSLLRAEVYQKGLNETVKTLQFLGADRANEVNIRNWISYKTISPKSFVDFRAIMKMIKLEDKAEEYWQVARTLEKAHRMAGFRISKMLLKIVVSSDLNELERYGSLEFELPGLNGGSLTAFRVEEVSPNTYLLPVSRLGRIFERDELFG